MDLFLSVLWSSFVAIYQRLLIFGPHNFNRPQRSCGQCMFLHVCVILFTGGGLQAGRPPPTRQTPPRDLAGRTSQPPDQADTLPPPGPGRPISPPPERRLQHTVNERPVRILLEYILVLFCFFAQDQFHYKLKIKVHSSL